MINKEFLNRGIKWIEKNYPIEFNIINNYLTTDIKWLEKYYLYNNSLIAQPKCYCGNSVNFINSIKGYYKYCSPKCKAISPLEIEKIKNTNLEKYGNECIFSVPEFKERITNTIKEIYGVDNISQSEEIKEKKKATSIENCGFEYNSQRPESRENLAKCITLRQDDLQEQHKIRRGNYWESKLENLDLELINRINNELELKSYVCEHTFKIDRRNLNDRIRNHNILCTTCNEIILKPKLVFNTEQFINEANKIHNFRYEYISNYVATKIAMNIKCNECGCIFNQQPSAHLQGNGCPKCCSNISVKEIRWLDMLNISEEHRNKNIFISGQKFIPDAKIDNVIYEFYGDYWHGNPQIYKSDKMNKTMNVTFGELYEKTIIRENYLKENGYTIVSIWENEFNKLIKKSK